MTRSQHLLHASLCLYYQENFSTELLCSLTAQVGDANSLTADKDKQVERMGLTPDWIIQVTLTIVFTCNVFYSLNSRTSRWKGQA